MASKMTKRRIWQWNQGFYMLQHVSWLATVRAYYMVSRIGYPWRTSFLPPEQVFICCFLNFNQLFTWESRTQIRSRVVLSWQADYFGHAWQFFSYGLFGSPTREENTKCFSSVRERLERTSVSTQNSMKTHREVVPREGFFGYPRPYHLSRRLQ